MKEFPKVLSVSNKQNFPEMFYNRMKCYLRKEIYEHMISHSNQESEYFSLDDFSNKLNNKDFFDKMIKEVQEELKIVGWNSKLSFGGTGLFIYSSEEPPSNCWQE